MQSYAEHFERHEVNGRKLALLEPSDLEEMSIDNSSHQLHIFKSIQNLLNVVSIFFMMNRQSDHCS